MIVHLIRHGQSYNTHRPPNEPYPANPPLTPIGVRQAARVAERMAAVGIDRLVASPMLRAVETADHVGRATGLQTEILFLCHEHRLTGAFDCYGAGPLRERYPDLVIGDDLHPEGWVYGDEPLERAIRRAEGLLAWLRAQAALGRWQRMALVSHGAITRIALARLLGVLPDVLAPMVIDNTSICTLDVGVRDHGTDETGEHAVGGMEILALNDTAHLAGDPEIDPMAGISR